MPDEVLQANLASPQKPRRRRYWLVGVLVLVIAAAIAAAAADLPSRASAAFLAQYVEGITFSVDSGPAAVPAVPGAGPLDVRLGYRAIPSVVARLQERGFAITTQASVSDQFNRVANRGLFPPYEERTQAGLTLLGRGETLISSSRFPVAVYASFDEIPAPVRNVLLFLENRELLDDRNPYRNPAVEWDRLAAAVASFAGARVLGSGGRFGASTLATQLEKVRHSPGGVTRSPGDKVRQMASATLRAYQQGPLTTEARRRILLDYLNALPVGAMPGYGEVIGLRDGVRVWFGLDPDSADAWLREAAQGRAPVRAEAAGALRAVMAILIAQRRPSYYLQSDTGRANLLSLTDSHLRLVAPHDVVPGALASAALTAPLALQREPPRVAPIPFVERKAINAVRSALADLVGAPGLYQLDRYDLAAHTTIDSTAQRAATRVLRRLADRAFVQANGLDGDRLLGQRDPSPVSYALVLYERTAVGNALRIQVDNLDRPFDLNSGARLELGSTAKLRTLVSYLEIVAQTYAQLTDSLAADTVSARTANDPITRWAREVFMHEPWLELADFLAAAMERRYPANPTESFFTGGGVHRFANFDRVHDQQAPTVLEAFRSSINLVFVRLMRDIVLYHQHRLPGWAPGLLDDPDHPARRAILSRFADAEGRAAIERAARRHRGISTDSSLRVLLGSRITLQRYGRLLRAVSPDIDDAQFRVEVTRRFPDAELGSADLIGMARAVPSTLNLSDRAFVTGTDPLELWVVSRLRVTPSLTIAELQAEGATARQDASAWLFRRTPAVGRAQDRALRIMLERDAFQQILLAWRRVGYPYEDIVASLGTSIGSSGDRPGALAELVGIIVNGGERRPPVRIEQVALGVGTPFEVTLRRRQAAVDTVLRPEVAAAARAALADVVANGTASFLKTAVPDGQLALGGKTGTGDNVVRTFGRDGRQVSARTTSRTATFAFFLGDRFFGVATAYVDGPDAAQYTFTSGLPVRILGLLLPELRSLLDGAQPARQVNGVVPDS
jgi:membrane peptidoglycan carboxypeptidase